MAFKILNKFSILDGVSGSTEASSDKVEILCGPLGVFAAAKLIGIDIKSDQKVIEVVDRSLGPARQAAAFRHQQLEEYPEYGEPEEEEEGEDTIVLEGDQEPETMEITPQIPMFDLGSLLYPQQQYHQQGGYEEQSELVIEEEAGPVENEDFYICKLPSCGTMIQFENCGARSKILNHYTSHFQRELEQAYGHLLSDDMHCTLCDKDLRNFIKSKIWIHIGVTHDKTNAILEKKGIEPVSVNIRMKRKASDAFRDSGREEVSPRFEEVLPQLPSLPDYQTVTTHKANTCKLCGQVTQNRKRLLKHYCTKHFIDRLGNMEMQFIVKNKCVHCGKDFIGAKKSSKVIHIGLEHKQIFNILDEEFGKDGYLKYDANTPVMPPLKKIKIQPDFRPIAPKLEFSSPHTPAASAGSLEYVNPVVAFHNTPRTEASMSERMKEVQELGNRCFVCNKQFDLFRSMLLPHYCGHFYKEIAQGHEDYFTLENCKLCGAKATKRKSRIIHLGVKHELVLPYIEDVLRKREPGLSSLSQEDEDETDNQNEFIIDESELKSDPEEATDGENKIIEDIESTDVVETLDEPEQKMVSPLKLKTLNQHQFSREEDEAVIEADTVPEEGNVDAHIKVKEEDQEIEESTSSTSTMPDQGVLGRPKSETNHVQSTIGNNFKYSGEHVVNGLEPDVDEFDEGFEDEVTIENLGLICKICQVAESTDHDLLTHYCSHFIEELKEVAEKMVNEDHKCIECHKMLGNNKRRLFHFGVKHLKVIPMINNQLRNSRSSNDSVNPNSKISRKKVDESEDLTEEDDFEITYDPPAKIVEEHSGYRDAVQQDKKGPGTPQSCSKAGQVAGVGAGARHSNPRVCELCGCKRNTSSNLLLHYTKQHFLEEIKRRFGGCMENNQCKLCQEKIDVTVKNVGEAERWIHLGHRHNKTNLILQELGKTMIIIKGYNDLELEEPSDNVENDKNGEIIYNSEDVVVQTSTPPPPALAAHAPPTELTEVFSCDLCNKTTKSQSLLDLHLIAIHYKKEILQSYGNPEHICNMCNKTFQNADAFAFHVGKDHDFLKLIMQENGKSEEKAELEGEKTSVKQVAQPVLAPLNLEQRADGRRVFTEEGQKPSIKCHTSVSSSVKCPLKCSTTFLDNSELLNHFRTVHGFNNDIIKKVLRAHPQLQGLADGENVLET